MPRSRIPDNVRYSYCYIFIAPVFRLRLMLSLIDRRMDGRKKAATEDNKMDESIASRPLNATFEENGQQSGHVDRKELSGVWHPGVKGQGSGFEAFKRSGAPKPCLTDAMMKSWGGGRKFRGERPWPKFSDERRCAKSHSGHIDKYL